MPLKSGSSKKVISSNVKELVGAYKEKGKIGTSRPASKKAAVKQAVAIAYSKARGEKSGGSIVKKQEERIKAKGGKVTFKKDGKLRFPSISIYSKLEPKVGGAIRILFKTSAQYWHFLE